MCNFFSFLTDETGKKYYFDWTLRQANKDVDADSHSSLCKFFKVDEDKLNKYEYNPLLKTFLVDQINSPVDDRIQAEEWVRKLDFATIVPVLVVKPIVDPFALPAVTTPTSEQIKLLEEWASVGASVWDSVRASVWDSVWASVRDSVGAYIGTFFAIGYGFDFSSSQKLWEDGLVPSFDGTTWRLHSGKDAKIIYEWKP